MPHVGLAGRKIFVLEHDATAAYWLRTAFEKAGAEILFAFEARDALVRVERFEFDAAVLDGIDYADVCNALGGVPFMFYVAHTGAKVFPDWPDAPVLVKPADATRVVETIAKLVE